MASGPVPFSRHFPADMPLPLPSRLARLIARMMVWVMLAASGAGIANACVPQAPQRAADVRESAHGSPCHDAVLDEDEARSATPPQACETFCKTGHKTISKTPNGAGTPASAPLPYRGPVFPKGRPAGLPRLVAETQPPAPALPILFLRLTI